MSDEKTQQIDEPVFRFDDGPGLDVGHLAGNESQTPTPAEEIESAETAAGTTPKDAAP